MRAFSTPAITHLDSYEKELRILVIIPAYNEEQSIGKVITRVREVVNHADVVVVNDGSKDETARLADALGAVVLNLPHNLGIGSAMQTGFLYAREYSYDVAVQVD